jgi:hypothetical protein
MTSGVIQDIEMLESMVEEADRKLAENPTEENRQEKIRIRWQLGSDYMTAGEYEKAVKQFESVLSTVPAVPKENIAEDGTLMRTVQVLYDLHLLRKKDPNYKPKVDYEALAVAAGVYAPMPEKE